MSPTTHDEEPPGEPPTANNRGRDHRHPRGWRVDPAPDGRGTPPAPRRSEGWRTLIGVVVFVVVLLVVNSWVASRIEQPEQRVRVPYSPVFLDQVHAGNVKSVSSRASTVQGTFRRALGYPPGDPKAKPSHLFVTEVPAFANTDDLFRLLRAKGVVVNAKPADQGPSWFESAAQRAAPDAADRRGDGVAAAAPVGRECRRSARWRSGARARGAWSRRPSASRSTTSLESTRPRRS